MNLKSLLMTLSPEIVYEVYCQTISYLPCFILNDSEISEHLDYKVLSIDLVNGKMIITIHSPSIV